MPIDTATIRFYGNVKTPQDNVPNPIVVKVGTEAKLPYIEIDGVSDAWWFDREFPPYHMVGHTKSPESQYGKNYYYAPSQSVKLYSHPRETYTITFDANGG